ncbi:glycoside hydrolase family 2 TIM barrel-domain containing protein [uncultured Lutibacter sp.]|uniref:glycoside hydrolase family 2 TIM barrel-domain containing protein n=1 Tax=uncultured Lutibacter sp. TaxID=437739 RepID=UPI00260C33DA|nr:glycoside hydrolase family 2 TIM barrel-domain containing protein [uncultured Lutibacter sp.]
MIKKFKIAIILSFIVFLNYALVSCQEKNNKDVVTISERKILVNDSVYQIKGVCYHPVPKGSDKRSFSNLTKDLALMVEAGINTIRVYEPIDDKAVLDEIYEAGLKVIIGIGYNQNGNFDILSGSFINYINTYKNHNAILLWELGNEYNYHPEWFSGDIKNWYVALNNAADLIHQTDQNHPVATAHGELPDALTLSLTENIDVWGINIYRWDNPSSFFSEWSALSDKPMYFSEAGADSYMTISKGDYEQGSNEKAQADATKNILENIFKNSNSHNGVTLYAFVDELWKAGNNDSQDPGGWAPNSSGVPYDGTPNEEYWGIVDIDRNKKEVFNVVKEIYTNINNSN